MDKSNASEAAALVEELIEELVDIEECILAGRPVPHARRYRYRVNKQHFVTETSQLTREQILERAHLVPTDQYRLRFEAAPWPAGGDQTRPDGRPPRARHRTFIAQPKEVQDGLEVRREFALSAA